MPYVLLKFLILHFIHHKDLVRRWDENARLEVILLFRIGLGIASNLPLLMVY